MVRQAAPYVWLKERARIVGRISVAPSDNLPWESPEYVGWRCAYPTYSGLCVRWELGLFINKIALP
ncbi:MAG: hypothetical protein ABW170_16855, partial [Candidatus Thiodiazotropha sp. L084R]